MSTALSTLERALHPATAGIAALIGAVGGGAIYLSLSGAALGLITALGVLGIAAIALSVLGWLSGDTGQARRDPTAAPSPTMAAAALVPSAAQVTSSAAATGDGVDVVPTETEAESLAAGRFADYHLAKAQRLLAAGHFKEAVYQAGASLSHGDLPEARQVLATARAAMKS